MNYKDELIPFSDVCLSGGADGADLCWGYNAGKNGHKVIHWSFENHYSKAPSNDVCILTSDLLLEADEYLKKANKTLKRKFPTKSEFTNNLLRRNLYQIKWSESVYAVSTLDKKGNVKGGTAWAIQLFIDRFEETNNLNLFLFCQENKLWFKWTNNKWNEITNVPSPKGIYAGIGSRKLDTETKDAIRKIYNL